MIGSTRTPSLSLLKRLLRPLLIFLNINTHPSANVIALYFKDERSIGSLIISEIIKGKLKKKQWL